LAAPRGQDWAWFGDSGADLRQRRRGGRGPGGESAPYALHLPIGVEPAALGCFFRSLSARRRRAARSASVKSADSVRWKRVRAAPVEESESSVGDYSFGRKFFKEFFAKCTGAR
jgi:hypothetical protein